MWLNQRVIGSIAIRKPSTSNVQQKRGQGNFRAEDSLRRENNPRTQNDIGQKVKICNTRRKAWSSASNSTRIAFAIIWR